MHNRTNCSSLLCVLLGMAFFSSQPAIAQQVPTPACTNLGSGRWKHPKGMDDLEAIGTRNISGGRMGNWYSIEKETRLGKDYAYEIEGFTRPLRDSTITEYVNRVGQNLVRNSDAKVNFVIKVLDSEEVNAFALPGGFLYVNRGLLLATENEAELAGIMAHEIAHVAARHATRQMTRSQIIDFASLPLIAFGGAFVLAARETVGSITTLKFSRNYEVEADYLAVEYAYKAGYDPAALLTVLERLSIEERQSQGSVANALATHPQSRDRITRMQQEIAHILPVRQTYIVSTSDFDEMRARLLADETKPSKGERGNGRPKLRRREDIAAEQQGASVDGPVLSRE